MGDKLNKTIKESKSGMKRTFRSIRIIINLLLLTATVIVIVQNSHKIQIDFLWMQVNISLALLIFVTGSIGSVITLFFLLFKK